jgi:hypothetical protein
LRFFFAGTPSPLFFVSAESKGLTETRFVSADSEGVICTKMVHDSAWFGTAHNKGLGGRTKTGTGVPCPYKRKTAADAAVEWMYVYPIWTITDWVLDVKKKALSQFAADPVLEGIQDVELVASAAMSTAVEPTAGSAVKAGATPVSASTMEVAATITTAAAEAVAAMEVPTAIASSIEAASVAAVPVGAVSATAVIAAAVAISATVVAAPVIAVVPGAGADEDAADEPVRPVVSVGSAVVGGIIVVAIGADWRGAVIDGGADTNPEGDALGVGVGGGEKTNTETNCE